MDYIGSRGEPPYPAPTHPQRVCSACRTDTFFVTYAPLILSLICTNCRRSIIFYLEKESRRILTKDTLEKGDGDE